MNLKNYTSQVPADRSISRIERMLVEIGANNINKQYTDGQLKALSFLVIVNGNTLAFRLPAKVDVVQRVLWDEVKRPQSGTRQRIRGQAERTAWKIVCDWVETQTAMIKLEQAEFAEMFLPYVYSPELDQTFYERIKESDFKLLGSPK